MWLSWIGGILFFYGEWASYLYSRRWCWRNKAVVMNTLCTQTADADCPYPDIPPVCVLGLIVAILFLSYFYHIGYRMQFRPEVHGSLPRGRSCQQRPAGRPICGAWGGELLVLSACTSWRAAPRGGLIMPASRALRRPACWHAGQAATTWSAGVRTEQSLDTIHQ